LRSPGNDKDALRVLHGAQREERLIVSGNLVARAAFHLLQWWHMGLLELRLDLEMTIRHKRHSGTDWYPCSITSVGKRKLIWFHKLHLTT